MHFTDPTQPKRKYKWWEHILICVTMYLIANLGALLIALLVYSLGATGVPPLAKVFPTIALAHWVVVR